MLNNTELQKILPLVQRPGRYTDNELNSAHKNWDQAQVRIALAFPDLYEIGMSGLGLGILYSIANRMPLALADRAYLPAPDMEQAMRSRSALLCGWESGRPLRDFDVLGITLQTELCYAGVLNLLDLAGVPLYSAKRGQDDPIVIGGGSCCANPLPLSPFFDAFVIGDGEEAIVEICESLRDSKSGNRKPKIERLARIPGVYVPAIHDKSKARIRARQVDALRYEYAPDPPLVPLVEVTHDRLTVEIARGCTRGCRFCQAGMVYRPVRRRSQDDILKLAKEGIAQSGWDEVSLLSLSSSDYPGLLDLLNGLNSCFAGQKVAVSLPSLRLDSFDGPMIDALMQVKKTGLTFAPEAGSQRLRDAINKGISEQELLDVVKLAKASGWMQVKLYFMIGLPTETKEDLEALCELCHKAARLGVNLKVSVSPFVPKPQTPFQWERQDSLQELHDKVGVLIKGLKGPRIQLKWHDLKASKLEAVLARGDASISGVIEKAWRNGARLDQWSEHFDWARWEAAFSESGLDISDLCGAKEPSGPLPWGQIEFGVSNDFLRSERDKAYQSSVTPDCREQGCHGCGAKCGEQGTDDRDKGTGDRDRESGDREQGAAGSLRLEAESIQPSGFGRSYKKKAAPAPIAKTKFRLRYSKGPELRFISHLDLMRAWLRAVRRAGLPVAYSQGFSPHAKLSFGPPLPLGLTSSAEHLDIQLEKPVAGDVGQMLNAVLAPGLRIIESKPIFGNARSLSEVCDVAEYRIVLNPGINVNSINIAGERIGSREPWVIKTIRKEKQAEIDILPQIYGLERDAGGFVLRLRTVEGGAKLFEILSAILDLPEDAVKVLDIERTGMHHLAQGQLMNPMRFV